MTSWSYWPDLGAHRGNDAGAIPRGDLLFELDTVASALGLSRSGAASFAIRAGLPDLRLQARDTARHAPSSPARRPSRPASGPGAAGRLLAAQRMGVALLRANPMLTRNELSGLLVEALETRAGSKPIDLDLDSVLDTLDVQESDGGHGDLVPVPGQEPPADES